MSSKDSIREPEPTRGRYVPGVTDWRVYRLGNGKCNKANCSCTGYTKGDELGKCGCGHYAYDHL